MATETKMIADTLLKSDANTLPKPNADIQLKPKSNSDSDSCSDSHSNSDSETLLIPGFTNFITECGDFTENTKAAKEFQRLLTEVKENRVQEINLGHKEYSKDQLFQLCEVLKTNTSVISLDLSCYRHTNSLLDQTNGTEAIVIGDMLQHNKTLQYLFLRKRPISYFVGRDPNHARRLLIENPIFSALAHNTTLIGLDVSESGSTNPHEWYALIEPLKVNTTLKYLILDDRLSHASSSIYTDACLEEVKCLAEIISNNKGIVSLSLKDNFKGPRQTCLPYGTKQDMVYKENRNIMKIIPLLFGALAKNTHLRHLDLSFHHISGKAQLDAIGQLLKNNTTLQYLDLSFVDGVNLKYSGSDMSAETVQFFYDSLKDHPSLISVKLTSPSSDCAPVASASISSAPMEQQQHERKEDIKTLVAIESQFESENVLKLFTDPKKITQEFPYYSPSLKNCLQKRMDAITTIYSQVYDFIRLPVATRLILSYSDANMQGIECVLDQNGSRTISEKCFTAPIATNCPFAHPLFFSHLLQRKNVLSPLRKKEQFIIEREGSKVKTRLDDFEFGPNDVIDSGRLTFGLLS